MFLAMLMCFSKQGNKEKPVSWFSNIGFLLGLQQDQNYETNEHWDNPGLTFSYEQYWYIFYVEQFSVSYKNSVQQICWGKSFYVRM